MDIEKLPLIPAFHIVEYQREHSALAKKWNVVHAATVLVQLLAAYGVATTRPLPNGIKHSIKAWIRTPSSKQWLSCARSLHGLHDGTGGADPLWAHIGRFLDLARELLDDRNDLAHLVSLTSTLAGRIFETQRENIERNSCQPGMAGRPRARGPD